MIEEYVQIISNTAFPIAMCLFFMFRVEKLIKANTKALEGNRIVIEKCNRR